MTADEVKIAAVLSFHRYCRQENIDAADVSEKRKTDLLEAFIKGAIWMQEKCDEAALKAHEDAMRSLSNDARGG